ncbi:hypothetical protein L3Q82_016591 [Scortum barcoo]|uniref:Uncharacterized protein n=1 Tax=Scortum barcoo TaxID=214431 RepID=A0ACB8X856_9TELE|nr:hypothetical protein L3Q82_016591 [Scortum barcoo]
MICWIVLMSFICVKVTSLPLYVSSTGVFVVREASSFHQAKTNDNITIKWDIKIKTDMSHFILVCLLEVKGIKTVVFCVKNGVEVPESQDEHFAGRVQFDKDVLREGRIRLHVSRLRTDDSGNYWCDLSTIHGKTRTNGK